MHEMRTIPLRVYAPTMRIILKNSSRPAAAFSLCLAGALTLSACGQGEDDAPKEASSAPAASGDQTSGGDDSASGEEADAPVEAAGPQARIAYTYDGGVQVLDAESLEPVGKPMEAEGFTRLSQVGDNRHLALSEGSGWAMLDLGAWSQPHGDHAHSYTKDPKRTQIAFEGDHPGHVTHRDGRVLLWADGTGEVQEFAAEHLLAGTTPKTETWKAEHAHHGVAVPTHDGGMLVTLGTEDERTGVMALDADGKEIARSEECPGIHGEAEVKGAITFGCEDGMLVWRDGAFSKVDGPGEYSRMGNQRGSAVSPFAFADLKVEKDAEHERPEQVAVVDTRSGELETVDLGTSYWFRSLGRTPEGNGLVLGYDGALHEVDVEKGEVARKLPVIKTWKENEDWQKPGPNLFVMGQTAFVTEPATKKVHRIDLEAWKVEKSAPLQNVPNELSGVSGDVPGGDGHEGHHGEGDHEGHDHVDASHSH